MRQIDETRRLRALHAHQILDTPPEAAYDDLTRLAAHVCDVPIAVITLVDESRQWFKSVHGIAVSETERSIAFCAHTIEGEAPFIVEDAAEDPRFRDNPLVTGEPHIRFYAGVPLIASSGEVLGAFAVIDRVPRRLAAAELAMLHALARQAMSLLELRLERNLHRLTAARLAVAQRIGQMGSWELHTAENRLAWSDEIYRIVGLDHSQFGGRFDAFLALVHPQDRADLLHAQERALSGEAALDLVHRIVRPDGVVRYVRERAILLPDDAQGGKRLSGTVQDVTEQYLAREALDQRQAELQSVNEQLRLSEERFRFVAQATVDTIWDWNLLADTIWWNSGLQTQFGYAPDEIEPDARSWTDRIHPDDCQDVLDSIHTVIDGTSNDWERKYRFRRADGSYAQVVDRGFVIRDPQGKAVRMVGGMTDITEQLALAEQLRQSQRLESVGQLTGGMAHDFNNLLTVILGNAELLSEQLAENARLGPLAEMIASAALRGSELTQRLLAFARRQALEPRAVSLDRLVQGMDGLLRRTLGEHIEIEIIHGTALWQALVDPAQLESALLNLCLNARDAMSQGGRLSIQTDNAVLDQDYVGHHVDVKPGRYVMLSVSDTGTGIAPEHLGRVFEPFFTTKEKSKGTGLGLAMVYGFIKQSGGQIDLYSELGHGTTVKLYLPQAEGQRAAIDPPAASAAADDGSEIILLVEDDALVRRYVHEQLTALGYRVIEAESGPRALELIRAGEQIDLLFTDMVMPGGMNGRELADHARKLRPDLRVLFTSGYTEDVVVHQGRLESSVPLLSKPYRRTELARRLRDAFAAPPRPGA